MASSEAAVTDLVVAQPPSTPPMSIIPGVSMTKYMVGDPTPGTTPLEYKLQGNEMFKAKKYPEAIRLYTQAIDAWVAPTTTAKSDKDSKDVDKKKEEVVVDVEKTAQLLDDILMNRSKAYFQMVAGGRKELAHLVYNDMSKIPLKAIMADRSKQAYWARVLNLVGCYNEAAKVTSDLLQAASDTKAAPLPPPPHGWPDWESMNKQMVAKAQALVTRSNDLLQNDRAPNQLRVAQAYIMRTSEYEYAPTFSVARPVQPPELSAFMAAAASATTGGGGGGGGGETKTVPLFEVRETPGRGLGLFATADIPLGTIIFEEDPFVFAPLQEDCCFRCASELLLAKSQPIKCPRCGFEVYCSQECCDKAYNEYHAALCGVNYSEYRQMIRTNGALSQSTNQVLTLRLLGRLVMLSKSSSNSGPFWTSADPFVRHWAANLVQQPQVTKTRFFAVMRRFYQQLVGMLASAHPEPIVPCNLIRDFDLEMFDAMYTLATQGGIASLPRTRGVCLYKYGSLVNHDCAPNSQFAVSAGGEDEDDDAKGGGETKTTGIVGNRQRLTALQDIPRGREILCGYVFGTTHTARREHLARTYGFTCKCDLCLMQEKHPLDTNCKCALCSAVLTGMREAQQ